MIPTQLWRASSSRWEYSFRSRLPSRVTPGERLSASRIVILFQTSFKIHFQRSSLGYCSITNAPETLLQGPTAPVKWIEGAFQVRRYAPTRLHGACTHIHACHAGVQDDKYTCPKFTFSMNHNYIEAHMAPCEPQLHRSTYGSVSRFETDAA